MFFTPLIPKHSPHPSVRLDEAPSVFRQNVDQHIMHRGMKQSNWGALLGPSQGVSKYLGPPHRKNSQISLKVFGKTRVFWRYTWSIWLIIFGNGEISSESIRALLLLVSVVQVIALFKSTHCGRGRFKKWPSVHLISSHDFVTVGETTCCEAHVLPRICLFHNFHEIQLKRLSSEFSNFAGKRCMIVMRV